MKKCILCDGCEAMPEPPAGLSYRQHAYLFGFADGAQAARTQYGPVLCEQHAKHVDAALAARGIKAVKPVGGGS